MLTKVNKVHCIIMLLIAFSMGVMSCEKPEADVPEGEGTTSKLKGVTLTLEKVNATTAYFTGVVKQMTPDMVVGIHWDYEPIEHISNTTLISTYDFYEGGKFLILVDGLSSNKMIYYMPYVYRNGTAEYGDCLAFKTPVVTMTIDEIEVNGLVAVFKGIADLDGAGGILCSTDSDLSIQKYMKRLTPEPHDVDGLYICELTGLSSCTTYYYRTYYYDSSSGAYVYGDVKSFTTDSPVITIDNVSVESNEVTFTGKVELDCVGGILYSTDSDFSDVKSCGNIDMSNTSENPYSRTCYLSYNRKYYYCTYFIQNDELVLGEINAFTTGKDPVIKDLSLSSATDLSKNGTANCYIVSKSGLYKIKTVKGNNVNRVLTNVASPELLWETFGTDVAPSRMDLISGVCYKDGYLIFKTADTFREGNAVIAAKDAEGNILWSWHIWFTDQPQEQVYYNGAGTMMDRNLGATSATPGDVGALGLLYQWGRKDPFLGSSSIHPDDMTLAKSTITWPSAVLSNSSKGTISYATANPTTFIEYNSSNYDWYYTGSESTDNTRWTTSETSKSIYDPCPAGWRVPDGGASGVWSTAKGSSSSFYCTYNSANNGMNFSGKFGNDQTIWYPASGCRDSSGGSLDGVGGVGNYWSASPDNDSAYDLYFHSFGNVYPSRSYGRAYGLSVRCLQE